MNPTQIIYKIKLPQKSEFRMNYLTINIPRRITIILIKCSVNTGKQNKRKSLKATRVEMHRKSIENNTPTWARHCAPIFEK